MKGSMSIYILYCPLKFLSMTVSCYTKQTVTNKLFEMHKIKNNFEQKYVLILIIYIYNSLFKDVEENVLESRASYSKE